MLKIKPKILKLFPIVMILFFSFYILFSARADETTNSNIFHYVFHLYYDNGQLNADRDFQFKYDVIPGDFIPDRVNTQFPYRGEIINMLGGVDVIFEFDPKQGDINFTKGKITVKAQYVADGQKAVFYDSQNQPILTIPVSDSSYCNDDGICNSDRGEDSLSCPNDCKQQSLPVPTSTTPASPTGGSGGLLSGILYTFGGLILAGLGWWFFKRRKDRNTFVQPPSYFPTPPPTTGGSVKDSVDISNSSNPQNPI